jgi:hypothetical protein
MERIVVSDEFGAAPKESANDEIGVPPRRTMVGLNLAEMAETGLPAPTRRQREMS